MIKKIFSEIEEIIVELFKKEEIWFFLLLLIVSGGYFSYFLIIQGIDFDKALVIIRDFLAASWWLWLFFILLPITLSTWLYWRNELFKSQIKWTLLELKIPRENTKNPKAMEQVLTAMHSLRNTPSNFQERWVDGELTRWFSLEIVSFGGEIHYYIRLYKKQKNLVEAAIYSYYPDVEVVEVEDYVNKFPSSVEEMYSQGYDLWGTEMLLTKPSFYPIKTYPHFVEVQHEEKMVDPMSAFLEVLGKLKPGEIVGIQILIAPAGDKWRFLVSPEKGWPHKWQDELEKLRAPKQRKTQGVSGEGGIEASQAISLRSPDETNILKEVENNLSKPAFNTLIRFIYLSPKETFYDSYASRGLVGAFNQYGALNLNSFRQNHRVSTRTLFWYFPYFFPNLRNELKKQRLLRNYRLRDLPPETFMGKIISSHPLNWNTASKTFEMNTECLATLFHVPTETVLTTPHIQRIESQKVSPPVGLPIFGEEEEIEKFK